MPANLWTDEKTRMVVELRIAGHDYTAIAERVGRTPDACQKRVKWILGRPDGPIFPDDPRLREFPERGAPESTRYARALDLDLPERALPIPAEVLADRDRRAGMARNLTAAFFGDPLPGYSALDRRGA